VTARTTASKLRPVEVRLAVRRWLAAGLLWSQFPPDGVEPVQLNAELRRLMRQGVVELWAWEVEGLHFELAALPEFGMVAGRVYRPGPLWPTYMENVP
jgi:hypothetical protein